jgi:hypothetical protein
MYTVQKARGRKKRFLKPVYVSPQSLCVQPQRSNGKAVDKLYGHLFTLQYVNAIYIELLAFQVQ